MKVCYFFMAGIISIMFASCTSEMATEKMAMVKNGSNFLKVEVTDEFAAAATRADYSGFPATTFETGDAIGLYAFNGTSYVASNVQFVRQSDGSWTSTTDVPYGGNLTYYAYFPYSSAASGYTPSTSGTLDDIDTKFAQFINDNSDVFYRMNQSTKDYFTYCNLMISKGVVTAVTEETATIKFTMQHKRGLAIIDGVTNQWYYSDIPQKKHPLELTDFTVYLPYTIGGTHYYLLKPNTPTNFCGNTLQVPAGEYKHISISLSGSVESGQFSSSIDNGNTWTDWGSAPSWFGYQVDENNDIAVTRSDTYTAHSESNVVVREVPGDEILKAATPVSNVDLSMVDCAGNARASRTTANCYMVHAPGTYKIPLVYGCAIKNGTTNSQSYIGTGVYPKPSEQLKPLINHNGTAISDPWLKNNNATPDAAELLWQDVNGMISSVGLDGDYLVFTVDAEKIAEGNAVIAVKKSGTIVWSWHIWATTETYTDYSTLTTTNQTYKVPKSNLGQINGYITYGQTVYDPGLCKSKIRIGFMTIYFECQSKRKIVNGGTWAYPCNYYQGGRKDPFCIATGMYSADGTYSKLPPYQTSTASVAQCIQNPNKMFNNNSYYLWSSFYFNLWDSATTSFGSNNYGKTVKTIYDPCPPGFCVPEYDFSYYIKGKTTYNNDTYNRLYYFGTGVTGDPICFPIGGQRYVSIDLTPRGNTTYTSYMGYYHTASMGSNSNCLNLRLSIQSNGNGSASEGDKGTGIGNYIRPVADDRE